MSYDYNKTLKDNFELTSNGKYTLEMFPQEYIDLNREIATGNHPKLHAILASCSAEDIDLKLAHIASYCQVVMDGDYTLESRMKLCKILKDKLILLREPENVIIVG